MLIGIAYSPFPAIGDALIERRGGVGTACSDRDLIPPDLEESALEYCNGICGSGKTNCFGGDRGESIVTIGGDRGDESEVIEIGRRRSDWLSP